MTEQALETEIVALTELSKNPNLSGEERANIHNEIVALQNQLAMLKNTSTREKYAPIALALLGGYVAMKRTKDVPVTIASTYGLYCLLEQIM
jgi:hypothetical protein